jgi:mannose-1-phosphate guanylyltransferase/mannose-6-phosphate isomerase
VPLNTYWNDLGSFDALYEAFEKDEHGNAVSIRGFKGDYINVDSKDNLIITERLTATVGVKDLVIIDTGDALLVAKKGETQKVKEVYKKLVEKGDERALVHRTAYRPWGSYTVLEEGERYKIKRLTVLPGKRLSLQRHYHRSEHWVVVRGTAKVKVGDKELLLRPGESTFIPAGVVHRLENPGKVILEVIETQIGEYLGEDDIERFQDDFGRD